jgi:hypothetical protein
MRMNPHETRRLLLTLFLRSLLDSLFLCSFLGHCKFLLREPCRATVLPPEPGKRNLAEPAAPHQKSFRLVNHDKPTVNPDSVVAHETIRSLF